MRNIITILLLFVLKTVLASDPYPRNEAIDILHYQFSLELNDSTDRIAGEAIITIRFKKPVADFVLDLVGVNDKGHGMTVKEVMLNNQPLKFTHQNNRLKISLTRSPGINVDRVFTIRYSGIPEDGLIISKNKFGDRTFFGDNWPNRGQYWLPSIDHPSDKARVDFVITAPEQYMVVASGRWREETNLPGHRKLTRWEETVEIPVKVMTIGVARFAVEISGEIDHIPLSTWVYPQNRDEGFRDFAVAPKIFDFFHRHIGPYPYEKLAHVQSKTRWGGLENASNIFYFENSVNGKNEREGLIAHESAHQWFGNSVTENDWHHVWLSEGFATYFAALYFEYAYGHDRLQLEMQTDRKQVTDYFLKNPKPVVDTTLLDIGSVLSPNTYQKAGWVLHMLRHEIGDAAFWDGIQKYYSRYRNKNALTQDFRLVMEEVSGKDLKPFFKQWLYHSGHPQLQAVWNFDAGSKAIRLTIKQSQETPFVFPLDIGIKLIPGATVNNTVNMTTREQTFTFPSEVEPSEIILDPFTWLLFEGSVTVK